MIASKEISALFQLIDDPDEEVFDTVTNRLISLGNDIIPGLENLWETTPDEHIQGRIEMIIHKLHFGELLKEFIEWKDGPRELLQGALLICKYSYPELNVSPTLQEIEKIRRNIWLELNSYLTPLEQANVISGILYNFYNLKGNEVNYTMPDEFLLSKLLDNKVGNSISNGILYLIFCQMLDISAKAVNIPRQFIIGYFDVQYNFPGEIEKDYTKINFYVDPLNGQVYSNKDVENYFKRISVHPSASYFKPLTNIQIIKNLMEEYAQCFNEKKHLYKKDDLLKLAALLEE
jgi:regulator of sirC expression with transglutaminase-like and TPR domain